MSLCLVSKRKTMACSCAKLQIRCLEYSDKEKYGSEDKADTDNLLE